MIKKHEVSISTKIGKLILLNTLILGIKDNIGHLDTLNRTCGVYEGLEEAQRLLKRALTKIKDEL